MSPEFDREFERDLNQLVRLINRLIKNLPTQGNATQYPFISRDAEGNIQLNLYFSFFPVSPDDLEELEDLVDECLPREEKADHIKFHLSPDDEDFLHRNGLRF